MRMNFAKENFMEYLRYYDEIVSRRQSCRDFTDTVVDAVSGGN